MHILHLREVQHHSSLLKDTLCLVTTFQREHFKGLRVGMSNFTVRKPNEQYLNQVMKVNINSNKSY